MKAKIRLMIINNEMLMGPGTRELLEKIDEFSSISEASKSMGMSYTKCLKMLKRTEEELGSPAVVSEKGGISRGSTRLTPKGRQMLSDYTQIEEKVHLYAQQLTDEKFNF